MRIKKAMLVFRKDWREIKRNWQVILPIIVVPIMISVFLPILLTAIPSLATTPGTPLSGFEAMIQNLPNHVQEQLAGMTEQQVMIYIMALYFFAPFFLIIPLMASSVIASDSFAGEKERKTIEALLATPISDGELFLGKMLVSFIPSMIVTSISFLVYSTVFDLLSFSIFNGTLLLPNLDWFLLIFGLAPTVALASIGLTVMISAKVKGFKEAQQISVILLIPILALVFGQATGAIIFGPIVITALIGLFVIIDLAIFRTGVKLFKREEILSKIA
ncbi:MAG: ABC transporter permease subunit [Candidatus Methylarchaceae archaeon HK01B]|nr:ABC transporter permease subunit [Candidatus Methylarchaceae archaeon HK01M]MCP8312162.1 ABC transporter permease subunit [Candidatus Methylarchaceae archaeon HK02M1]MCP8318397.1 ABC transporter permease subunit [Candidatus Methylarchaceae archaeon HK01B]